ncbi:MAG: [Fe-Fe] hydrogenase large subunit C-terminal domain-containing protein [Candidatus Spyradocola sp.]|nr:[Fe-Fe] hydrogenase large subunit C-terminal domain-containing protein [Candidatus Spyradocola sp.]
MSAIESKKANCKNCYKCLRACPVKAIRFTSGQAEIMPDLCVSCGTCVQVCPQGAQQPESQLKTVQRMIERGENVVASLAPSFYGAFKVDDPMKLVGALKALGFKKVCETAVGAAIASDAMADVLKKNEMDNVISTCCPAVNDLIEKHYPELVRYLAPVVSPMVAHGRYIKKHMPEAKVVFVGPCFAKIDEARDVRVDDAIDAVLTFADLEEWMKKSRIVLSDAQPAALDSENAGLARMYPTNAGVIHNVLARGVKGWQVQHIEGSDACFEMIKALKQGDLHHIFIEMNMCTGSCMGGPARMEERPSRFAAGMKVRDYGREAQEEVVAIDHSDIALHKAFIDRSKTADMPNEEQIRSILRSIGKESKADELNCGSCGYPSCRAKAIAVYQGKAELSMCLPHMFQIAQSTSNVVLQNTPNIILIVDENLKITELNASGQRIFGLSHAEATEKYLYELFDPRDFEFVLESYETIVGKPLTIDEYNLSVEQTLVYLPNQHGVMGILRDVSAEKEQEEKLYKLRLDTMEMAQKVIDKQMVAAQEIASLLGETTAETKATLTHLKDIIITNGDGGRV